jgi:hypothetical protein
MLLKAIFGAGSALLTIGSTIALVKKAIYYSKQVHRYSKAFKYTKK